MGFHQNAQPAQAQQAQQAQQAVEQAQQAAQAAQAQAELMRAQAELRRAQAERAFDAFSRTNTGVPVVVDRPRGSTEKQEKMFFVGFLFTVMAAVAILYPIARALGRRLERGGKRDAGVDAGLGAGTAEQLQRIEHTVEAMAIEIERLSEGQRFTTKLLASRGDALGVATDAERARRS